MIEVEKKFSLKEGDFERLTQGAELIRNTSFTDTYFDTQEYSLTKSDKWLRLRDDKYELKLPLNAGISAGERKLDRYEELVTEADIRAALGLPMGEAMEEMLKTHGYTPFVTIVTTRQKFKKDGFTIDLDVMDYGYSIGEIELMVESEEDMNDALEKILKFAQENGISIENVPGKVIEYLRLKSPDHYNALKEAGVI